MISVGHHLVGDRVGSEGKAEQDFDGAVAGSTAVESKDEFARLGLEMLAAQAMIDAERPGREVCKGAIDFD